MTMVLSFNDVETVILFWAYVHSSLMPDRADTISAHWCFGTHQQPIFLLHSSFHCRYAIQSFYFLILLPKLLQTNLIVPFIDITVKLYEKNI